MSPDIIYIVILGTTYIVALILFVYFSENDQYKKYRSTTYENLKLEREIKHYQYLADEQERENNNYLSEVKNYTTKK